MPTCQLWVSCTMTTTSDEKDGTTIWDFDWDTYTLTISGNGEMEGCEEGDVGLTRVTVAPWNSVKALVRHVVIEEGVTSVNKDAFNGYSLIESVKLPQTLRTIGEDAFHSCTSLRSIDIPAGVERIEDTLFDDISLEEINMPHTLDFVSHQSIGDCSNLEEVVFETIPEFEIAVNDSIVDFEVPPKIKIIFIE